MEFLSHVCGRLDEFNREELLAEIERTDRNRADFLVLFAHEIRDPLTPMIHCLDALERRGEEAPIRAKALANMGRQVERLMKLSDGLLELSRITYGQIPLQQETLDLAQLIRQVVADLAGPCNKTGLTTTVQVDETPVWVRGDRIRLRQIVANLMENACANTTEGGVVEVALDPVPHSKLVRMTVRDSGIGIDPAFLEQIFEPFSVTNEGGNTNGLALALTKGLVAMHGGGIQASSEGVGRGAQFVVTLPRQDDPAVIDPASDPIASPPASADQRRRVLVIEDNRDGSAMLRKILEMAGHEVRAAYTGPEGIKVADEFTPDYVVCDIGLPELDGYRVADELRRKPATESACLIALTGYGTGEDRERSRRHGFRHHLTKPADPMKLLSLIGRSEASVN